MPQVDVPHCFLPGGDVHVWGKLRVHDASIEIEVGLDETLLWLGVLFGEEALNLLVQDLGIGTHCAKLFLYSGVVVVRWWWWRRFQDDEFPHESIGVDRNYTKSAIDR